jgi:biofilm protein TabA
MIYGSIHESDEFGFLLNQPAWSRAFAWLRDMPANPEIGKYPILGNEMFAMVMRYDTVEPTESRFESHRQYIDLQYTIEGAEWIAWSPSTSLQVDGPYDKERDLQFYHQAVPTSRVYMTPGRFSIYYPTDAHLPKISDGTHPYVYKAVIKVGRHLVS